ncbi:MAG: helix-turn-helix transcriptional regulator [Bacilli bacterium]
MIKQLGDIIQSNLELKNMTQAQLGKKIGLSQKAVSKYVTGKSMPSLDTLVMICSTLDININKLLSPNTNSAPIVENIDESELLSSYRLLDNINKKLIKDLLSALIEK